MSEEIREQAGQSFTDVVDARQDKGLETAVYVEGDLQTDPPRGQTAATRIAHFLCGENESVHTAAPGKANSDDPPDDCAAIQITLPTDPADEQWQAVQMRLLSRVPSDIDIVLLVDQDDVPWFCRELADVCVVAVNDGLEFYRVKFNPYSGDTFYQELTGLHPNNDR